MPRQRRLALVLGVVAIVAAACGGGSSGGGNGDPTAQVPVIAGERPVQVEGAGKVKLSGFLTVPPAATAAGVPGALLVPPGANGDRTGVLGVTGASDPLEKDLAGAFSRAGVATLRYDERGTGQSKLEPDVRLSVDDLVADARAGLDLLAQRRETAGHDLTVVGYDEGGLIALRLAAADPRVKRLVLLSTPGRSLVDVRAAQLQARFGPESASALRDAVAGVISTRTVPPLESLRTELRALLPAQEGPYLADLYGLDPVAAAAGVKAPTIIVVPADPVPYAPERLAATIRGAQIVTSAGDGTLTVVTRAAPSNVDDAFTHMHDGGPPGGQTARDNATVDRIAGFVAGTPTP